MIFFWLCRRRRRHRQRFYFHFSLCTAVLASGCAAEIRRAKMIRTNIFFSICPKVCFHFSVFCRTLLVDAKRTAHTKSKFSAYILKLFFFLFGACASIATLASDITESNKSMAWRKYDDKHIVIQNGENSLIVKRDRSVLSVGCSLGKLSVCAYNQEMNTKRKHILQTQNFVFVG